MSENHEFDEVYKRFKNLVLKVAYRYSQNKNIAEDVMQDTFLSLYKDMNMKAYMDSHDYENIRAWLYTTAKHKTLNYGRVEEKECLAQDSEENIIPVEPIRCSVEEEFLEEERDMERGILHSRIFDGLMQKNMTWYDSIRLVYGLELPPKEVAERLGMSVDTLYVTLHRAREWIQKTYDVEYKELKLNP